MRKTVDTLLLILLLIGPAVILTCVGQAVEEEKVEEINQTTTSNTVNNSVKAYAEARP